jgi:hypothetical protein
MEFLNPSVGVLQSVEFHLKYVKTTKQVCLLYDSLPYTFHYSKDKDKLIPLNRNYKPIGFGCRSKSIDNWINYELYDQFYIECDDLVLPDYCKELTKKSQSLNTSGLYLFTDRTSPFASMYNLKRYRNNFDGIFSKLLKTELYNPQEFIDLHHEYIANTRS